MPDVFDVAQLQVLDTIPILWDEIPDIEQEGDTQRSLFSRNYINDPTDETYFSLSSGYSLPVGWSYRRGGRLRYSLSPGQSVDMKFTARRTGTANVDSNEFTLFRRRAFDEHLVPNRIVQALAFNQSTDRVYVLNGSTNEVSPPITYLTSFNLDGVEQTSESFIIPNASVPPHCDGMTFDGTHFWLCGKESGYYYSDGVLHKINAGGDLNTTYTYTGGFIESMAWDGTHLWALDIARRRLRKFDTSGVEDESARITLDSNEFAFSRAQWGLAATGDKFFLPQSRILKCVNYDNTRDTSQDITVGDFLAGITYQQDTDTVFWIRDLTDDEGNRFGRVEAAQI